MKALLITGAILITEYSLLANLYSVKTTGKNLALPNIQIVINPTATPVPTLVPSTPPTPTAIPKPVYRAPIPTIDTDPMTNCVFVHSPAKVMKKSDCDRTDECELGSGNWSLVPSGQCESMQNNLRNQIQNNQPKTDPMKAVQDACVVRAFSSKESCYISCKIVYTNDGLDAGTKCTNACGDNHQTQVDNCYK